MRARWSPARPGTRRALVLGLVLLTALVIGSASLLVGDRTGGRHGGAAAVAIWGSSSAARMAADGRLAAALGTSVHDGAVAGDLAAETAARQGGAPLLLEAPSGTIPATGAVTVRPTTVAPRPSVEIAGTWAGVPGRFRSEGTRYVFRRRTPGTAVALGGPEPLVPTAGHQQQNAVTLLWMGKNDLKQADWATPEAATEAAWRFAMAGSGRVLVLGHFTDASMTPGDRARTAFDRLQTAYQQRYGDRFVDVQRYLSSARVWDDLDLEPTAADLAAQARGVLPPSLDDGSHGHLTTAAYEAIAEHLVRPQLQQLHWI